ncbi:hypothetical protein D3C71_1182040 [compost metagenome]
MPFLRLTILIWLFSAALCSTAKADSIPHQKRVSLQIAPLALIDFYNASSYKLGTEIRLSRSIYVSADFGGYFSNFNGLRNMRGGNVDFRIKYRFPNSNSTISVNYFYKKQSFEYHDSYEEEPDVPIVVYTRKQVNCINVNYEHKVLDDKWGYINLFAGLGVRFREVHSSFETHHDFDRLVKGGDSQSLYFVLIPGQNTWLNVTFGLRMGFYLF